MKISTNKKRYTRKKLKKAKEKAKKISFSLNIDIYH